MYPFLFVFWLHKKNVLKSEVRKMRAFARKGEGVQFRLIWSVCMWIMFFVIQVYILICYFFFLISPCVRFQAVFHWNSYLVLKTHARLNVCMLYCISAIKSISYIKINWNRSVSSKSFCLSELPALMCACSWKLAVQTQLQALIWARNLASYRS